MASVGQFCVLFIQVFMVLVGTQSLSADGITRIERIVTSGNCAGTNVVEVVRPCIAMANQIRISNSLPVTVSNTDPLLGILRRVNGDVLQGWLLDFELTESNFQNLCNDFKKIDDCLSSTITTCTKRTVTTQAITNEVARIRYLYPFSGSGKRTLCNPMTGQIDNSVKGLLKNNKIGRCLKSLDDEFKNSIRKHIKEVASIVIGKNITPDKSTREGRKARTLCMKFDEVYKELKLGGRCQKNKCTGKAIALFVNLFRNLLGLKGQTNCGKEIKETESLDKKASNFNKIKKNLSTVGLYGCSHIENSEIFNSKFETCSGHAADITLYKTDKIEITGSMLAVNKPNKICIVANEITIKLFGEKKNCGKKGDKPAKTFVIGNTANLKNIDMKIKCDNRRKIDVKYRNLGNGFKGVIIYEPCSGMASSIYGSTHNGVKPFNATYISFRTFKDKFSEISGELFAGCSSQVDISRRRRKRSTSSELAAAAAFDYDSTGVSGMSTGMLGVSEAQSSLEEFDDSLTSGSAMVSVNVLLTLVACIITILRMC